MRFMALILLQLTLFVSHFTLVAPGAGDEAALLAFKAAAISGGYDDPLASWNDSVTGGFCGWEAVTCRGRRRRVVALSLHSRGLAGFLSPAIGNLSSLRVLNLSSNAFSGAVPGSLGRLRRLQVLDLTNNMFAGELPVNLTSCTGLTAIHLRRNQLQGCVPRELGAKLMRLEVLNLRDNNLTGVIPESLANLSSLSYLDLSINYIKGTIPPGLGGIRGLQNLDLALNYLFGEPPFSLNNLSSLWRLQLERNMLHGNIPVDIGSSFPAMMFLSIAGNQFTGPIPASLANLTTLIDLELAKNGFSGYVPRTLGRLQALQTLYLFKNMLEANSIEGWEFITSLSNCSQLRELHIGYNMAFTGQLPSSVVNLSALQFLYMNDIGISGSIPSSISNLVNLEFLNVANTSISGVLPESIGKLGKLVELHMHKTQLSGPIPTSFGNISRLTKLYAFSANLEGPIPATLGKLKNLILLDLDSNRLNGSIPREIFKLPVLSSYLDLSYNSLSGPLPSEVGTLGNLNRLYLSGNQLSGEIPNSIGNCIVLELLMLDNNLFQGTIPQSLTNIKGLSTLNLSVNKLYGTIPHHIGSIQNLQELYLAHNNLSGPIPSILQNLTSLSKLDLSFNNLQGEVPKEGIFGNLANFSIKGNNELCGGIPQLHLSPCPHKFYESVTIVLATLLLLCLGIALSINKMLPQKQKRLPMLPIVVKQFRRVSYHALSNGTGGFSEANLLGRGSFGAVYKCVFQDEETISAVKVFNLEQFGSTRSFMAECEALRRLHHHCLIKIITCCSSITHQGHDFKALVLEFMPNGSLEEWLHPKAGMPTLSNTLSLAQRLDIAVNVMDALNYLHNHCHPPVVHCDLKPSNILLAEDMSARVGDFGMSRILSESASKTPPISSSTIGIRGTIGYVAPEYGEGSSVSTFGDVYSLGILLLEMFTGRRPPDDMFRGSLDLHKHSRDALPERIWEISDATMWLHTDTFDGTTRNKTENCLLSTIALGVSCSKMHPRERTLIQDAVDEMHAIRDSYLMFAKPCETWSANKPPGSPIV